MDENGEGIGYLNNMIGLHNRRVNNYFIFLIILHYTYTVTCTMNHTNIIKYLALIVLFIFNKNTSAQSMKQEKMDHLNYLVGEWVGTTTIYKNGKVSQTGAAYEKISYDLGGSILVIQLNTEFLQLRTIITYHEEDEKYYYHRFSKDGAAIYPAEYVDGQLVVWRDDQTRFIFRSTPEGGFQEYGEQWKGGEWIKTFEDNFINTQ